MLITEIRTLDRKRSRLWVDGCASFVLYQGEIRRYRLEEGTELSEQVWQELLEILTKRAKLRCMNLLKRADQTEAVLRRKLQEGYYPDSCIEAAVEYVRSYHYVDDTRYARQYLEYYGSRKSLRQMQQELLHRGISKETLEEVTEEAETNEEAALQQLIRKRCRGKDLSVSGEYQKQLRYLLSKGFAYDEAAAELRHWMESEEESTLQ